MKGHHKFGLLLIIGLILSLMIIYSQENSKIGTSEANSNYVTVVSMFFKLKKSKHSLDKYERWIENYLKSVSSPIVMYTDNESEEMILKIRHPLPIKIVKVGNIWEIMNQLEIERKRKYIYNYMNKQQELDREKHLHNPNLYAIWNLKSFMTELVTRENPFGSSFFIYADAGAWRSGKTPNWPNIHFVKQTENILNDRILFGQISANEADPYSAKSDIIEGGFFAGSVKAIKKLSQNFYDIHDKLMDNGKFIGKDQLMMKVMAFGKNKNDVVRLRTWGLECENKINNWFFFIDYFSDDYNFNCKNERDSLLLNLNALH